VPHEEQSNLFFIKQLQNALEEEGKIYPFFLSFYPLMHARG